MSHLFLRKSALGQRETSSLLYILKEGRGCLEIVACLLKIQLCGTRTDYFLVQTSVCSVVGWSCSSSWALAPPRSPPSLPRRTVNHFCLQSFPWSNSWPLLPCTPHRSHFHTLNTQFLVSVISAYLLKLIIPAAQADFLHVLLGPCSSDSCSLTNSKVFAQLWCRLFRNLSLFWNYNNRNSPSKKPRPVREKNYI